MDGRDPAQQLAQLQARLARERLRAQQLERSRSAEREVTAELLRLLDEAQGGERRARVDALLASFKEQRLRRQLAFRLGSTLVSGLRRPLRWWRLPLDLLRAVRAYRLDKSRGLLNPPVPQPDELQFRKNRLTLVPKSRWQRIVLPAGGEARELWAGTLPVAGRVETVVQVHADDDSVSRQVRNLPEATPSPHEAGVVELRLPAGRQLLLLHLTGERAVLAVRAGTAASSALKLELRRPAATPDAAPCRAAGAASIEPRPVANAVLWQADQLAADGHEDLAIDFATRHAPPHVRPAISLLKANRALGDAGAWQQHVNEYIAQFGISPIELTPGAEPLFDRLRAAPARPVDAGPLVSVIMPAFEAEATLRFAALSILRQTWRPLELIIVDDGSRDGTWDVVRELAAMDARVKAMRHAANVGPYVSKNLALAVAAGDYITGHDADDWAHPERIERHLGEVLRSDGRIQASMTCMLRVDPEGRFVHFAREGKASDDGALREAAISCLFDARFMRRHLGHWDSVRFGADSELIARARIACGDGFVRLRQFGMLCLDAESSLTNDPVHGVSKLHGVSPTRMMYREHWKNWHRQLSPADTYLAFPQPERRFPAPDAARVPDDTIATLVRRGAPAETPPA